VSNNAPRKRRKRGPSLAALFSLVLSCRPATAQGMDEAAARAYADGRAHEIEFTSSALAMLACATTEDQRRVILNGASGQQSEIAGAAVVSMRVADYRGLTSRVDSVLRGSRELDARTQHLDSLRVQLAVLRARMNARQSPQPASSRDQSPRSPECIAHP
jgi:hypothetical protein